MPGSIRNPLNSIGYWKSPVETDTIIVLVIPIPFFLPWHHIILSPEMHPVKRLSFRI
ncbi:MAG: hypothetical protein MUC31_06280 [Bacteroidales bacterium]|nr:hypothetical protein [Bacteroidales bacterium]